MLGGADLAHLYRNSTLALDTDTGEIIRALPAPQREAESGVSVIRGRRGQLRLGAAALVSPAEAPRTGARQPQAGAVWSDPLAEEHYHPFPA